MMHDWDMTDFGGLHCCKRCGAIAEANYANLPLYGSREECIDLPNVIPMSLRRIKQIHDVKGVTAYTHGGVIVERFDGSRTTITEDPA